jgi:hypothetical protein
VFIFFLRSVSTLAVALIATVAWSQTPTAVTTQVTGRVLESHQAGPLPGVTVEVIGTAIVVHTDIDGRYRLTVPAGPHQLKFTVPGFGERTVSVETTSTVALRQVDVVLALEGVSESVTVVAEGDAATAAVQLLERRRAQVITDNIGGLEMKANADSNAASALQRVTGMSLVDSSYVFVRGLGERYSNTTLNGATLPSTEPERKVVSLDMFPAGLLESVSVVKTYTPDRPADFAGGLVEIVPVRQANRRMANFSYSIGGNGQSWRQDVIDHTSRAGDFWGLPNQSRNLPASFPNRRLIRGGIYTPDVGVPAADLERYGESLVNDWSPAIVRGRPNQGLSASFGDRWGSLSLSGSLSHSFGQNYHDEVQTYFRTEGTGTLSPFSTYDYRVGAAKASLAGLVNGAYAVTPNNRIAVQGFSTDKTLRETRTFEGFNSDAARNLRNSRLLWQEESLRTFQVNGDHFLPELARGLLEWRASVSRSSRDEPDIREVLYEEIGGEFILADESQSGLRQFNDLDEDAWDFTASYQAVFTGARGLPATFKFGPSVSQRQRDFASRRFRFVPVDTLDLSLTDSPEVLFSAANIGPAFEFREETRATDFYTAEQRIVAGYGVVDVPLSLRTRLIGGVRVEHFRQTVDTFDLFDVDFDDTIETVRGEIEETDIFPAVNVVYDMGGNQNLRLSLSQTVNRPEFREVSPFEFTDIVGGRAVVGNPELERSLIRNVDVRWEWFSAAEEVVAASVFFKHFDRPIERFVEPTSQLRTSYTNAQSARNFGFELEGRRELSDGLLAGGNYTFVDSSITLDDFQTNVLTSLERPLSGTSKHVFNAFVEVRAQPVTARLLFNYSGARIVDVGSLGLPDIIEDGRGTVDLAVSTRLGRMLSLQLAAENLANRPVRFVQGSQTHRAYTLGRAVMVKIAIAGQ